SYVCLGKCHDNPPQIETQEVQSQKHIRNVTLKAIISRYSSRRAHVIMAEHLDTVGQSGQRIKTTLSTDYPHQDYKRQGGQLGHPFSGITRRKKSPYQKKW